MPDRNRQPLDHAARAIEDEYIAGDIDHAEYLKAVRKLPGHAAQPTQPMTPDRASAKQCHSDRQR